MPASTFDLCSFVLFVLTGEKTCADDSEDESDVEAPNEKEFMNAYTETLNEELRGTTLKKSFVRATDHSPKKDEVCS